MATSVGILGHLWESGGTFMGIMGTFMGIIGRLLGIVKSEEKKNLFKHVSAIHSAAPLTLVQKKLITLFCMAILC